MRLLLDVLGANFLFRGNSCVVSEEPHLREA